jgi:hypothetical protein
MPSYIRKADIQKEHLDLPIMNMLKKHLMVVSAWADMKAVIKGLMIANPTRYIRITSDREIRDVYVGSKSRAARGDEEGKIYNSLEDLMDPPDLMVLRLNELSYKNKAASGALEEAVSYRTDRDKPVWLFSDLEKPFTQGSHAYSDSMADLIKSNFTVYRIGRIAKYKSADIEEITAIDISQTTPAASVAPPLTQEAAKKPSKPVNPPVETRTEAILKKPRIKPSFDEDADVGLSMYGSGIATSSKYKRKS